MNGCRRRGNAAVALWLGSAPLLVACGDAGAGPAGAWRSVADTIGDTVVIRTVAGSVWGDTARLVEEFRIGALEGTDAEILGEPVALALDARGVLYVLDAQIPVVRAYDPQGRHLRDIGRKGAGPGEYGSPDGLAVLPDGRLLVRDPRTMRINLYGSGGEPLGAWDHPNRGNFHTYRTFYVDTAGTSWVTTVAGDRVPPWEWEFMVIGVAADGVVSDTVRAPAFLFEPAQLRASGPTGASVRRVPFTSEAVWDFSPFGTMVGGVTGEYAIYVFRPDGAVLRIERETEPVAVDAAEASERRVRITRGLQRQYGAWRWNGPDIPSTKPPWRDLFVDADGRIWVVVSRPGVAVMSPSEARAREERTGEPALRYREPPAFDVFDRDGRYLGPVAAPPGLRTDEPRPLIRGQRVWAVAEDETGVPFVVRYRLVR